MFAAFQISSQRNLHGVCKGELFGRFYSRIYHFLNNGKSLFKDIDLKLGYSAY